MTKPVLFEFAVPFFTDERLSSSHVPWVVGQLAHHHWKYGESMTFSALVALPNADGPTGIRSALTQLIEAGYVTEARPEEFQLGSDFWRISDREPSAKPIRLGQPRE